MTHVAPPPHHAIVRGQSQPARVHSPSAKKSVVDTKCKVHDARNVFVTDGAVFTTQGCYEPTLTIMAISARAGEHIAQSYRRGEL